MPVEKGSPWGRSGSLPEEGVVVRSDAEAGLVLTAARREGRPFPNLGLLGGDLCRTLGGRGDEERLRSSRAVTFEVDLGVALVDGRLHLFLAHLVLRDRLWTRAFVAMNAQWRGRWNLGPRAHPGDGLLDTYEVRLPMRALPAVRSRLHHGAHLPHPGIRERRAPAVQLELERPLALEVDGQASGRGRMVAVRVEPDAVTVVV